MLKSRIKIFRLFNFGLLACLCGAEAWGQVTSQPAAPGVPAQQDEVAVAIIKNKVAVERLELPAGLVLENVAMVVPRGKTISELLADNKIVPDAFSYSLVMDLNPQLKSIKYVKEGEMVVLPTINTQYLGTRTFRKYRFTDMFGIAGSLGQHEQLTLNVLRLKYLVALFSTFEKSRFQNLNAAADFQRLTTKTAASLEELRKLPLNSNKRASIIADSETTMEFLTELKAQPMVTAEDIEILAALNENVEIAKEQAQEQENQYHVKTLAIVKGVKTSEDYQIRVHGKKEGQYLIDRKRGDAYKPANFVSFDGVTDKTSQDLEEGVKYYFWVVRQKDGKKISPKDDFADKATRRKNCAKEYAERYELCIELSAQDVP